LAQAKLTGFSSRMNVGLAIRWRPCRGEYSSDIQARRRIRKMGRPKLEKGTANKVLFAVKIAANEAQKIHAAIQKSGMTKPEWAR
jgi:hypothetical protein